jgi:(4-(4-[2-(gamma-L-glutamylamino)ethyl]phenoxymethyl)furan-2-yl)methanamine synthase
VTTVIGMDIGGANTKAVFLRTENGQIEELRTIIEYFPVWKNPEKLAEVLLTLKEKVSRNMKLDGVGLTMTAELSDAYQTKREGVKHVLACVAQAFHGVPLLVLDVDATLRSIDDARSEPLSVAAANWVATGWLVAQLIETCVVVDVGSTSTSIIPVVDGRVSVAGENDLEKLMVGELVYTGSLRTNVATIVSSVPLRDGTARVASELFAQSGDVHLVLGNISEAEYTAETVDGRGKTRGEALARLARIVCADTELLTEKEIVQIAKYVYRRQVEQIAEGLSQVYSRVRSLTTVKIPVVVTGLGKDFLARTAAESLGVDEVIDLGKLTRDDVVKASPAAGVALMAASQVEGRTLKWTL